MPEGVVEEEGGEAVQSSGFKVQRIAGSTFNVQAGPTSNVQHITRKAVIRDS
jgi:hypothetical protein